MSSGAMNCPFLTFTHFPLFAAAAIRSVWRESRAGIWRTSATAAASSAWQVSWMSVRSGSPVSFLTFASILRPAFCPTPRNDRGERRLALSYEALKTISILCFDERRASRSAILRQSFSDSTTQGPAMKKREGDLGEEYLKNEGWCTRRFLW
jgi:hypothetical protein